MEREGTGVIQTADLCKVYDSVVAVDNVNLTVPQGQIYGFLGPNGAGKTTTLMMMLGVIRPTSGVVRLFGQEIGEGRMDIRQRIGVVPERHPRGTWGSTTVTEYLAFFASLFGVRRAGDRIRQLLERVGLAEARQRAVRELSLGMVQKLSMVRALVHQPDLLFLDEPINGLDPLGVRQVRDLILSENRDGRTIIISSHLLSEIERTCGHVGIMFRGRLIAEGMMTDLLARVSADREIEVELQEVPAGLTHAIARDLPFVLGCGWEPPTLWIRVSREADHRRELSEYLYRRGCIPLRFQEKVMSLEEAFVTITGENVELLARDAHLG
jgi:ABC-type multidrug transport system ATPase subunit